MSYIGNEPPDTGAYGVQSFDGGGTTFTLSKPSTTATVLLFIDGVRQTPVDAYSVSGVTLTTTATTPSGTDNVTVQFLGDVVDFGEPSDDSVSTAKIQDDAVTAAKLANSINTEIAANTAKVTNATHTGDVTGATALTIAVDAVDIAMLSATGTASSSTFLRGDNAWASAGGDNTPSFRAQNGSNQTVAHNTWAKVAIDTENWDTDSAYDASTNYRFTVPTGEGGKYIFWYGAYFEGGVPQDKASELALNVNGTTDNMSIMRTSASDLVDARIHGMSFPISLSATDYVEFYVRSHGGSNTTLIANFAVFGGMKMIGV